MDESGEVFSKIVEDLIKKINVKQLSLEEVAVRQDTVRKIWEKFNCIEEISWRQNSRVSWLKEGDRSTRFFHHMASLTSKVNYMGRIRGGSRI